MIVLYANCKVYLGVEDIFAAKQGPCVIFPLYSKTLWIHLSICDVIYKNSTRRILAISAQQNLEKSQFPQTFIWFSLFAIYFFFCLLPWLLKYLPVEIPVWWWQVCWEGSAWPPTAPSVSLISISGWWSLLNVLIDTSLLKMKNSPACIEVLN